MAEFKKKTMEKLRSFRHHPGSFLLWLITMLAAVCTICVLGFLVIYILIKGVPHLTPSLFAWTYDSNNVSMMPSIINTILMTGLTLLIAAPLGIFAAVYLVEYAKKGNKIVGIVRVTAETLTGIPSIVYGLFGMLFFVGACKWGYSLLSGAFTLAIMVLPVIMRTTEEALLAVPDSYREASFGILAGVILAIGRIVGETAALIYTAGTVAKVPENVFSSVRTLSVHMYNLSKEGLNTNEAYATAVVLLILVIIINMLSGAVAKKLEKR